MEDIKNALELLKEGQKKIKAEQEDAEARLARLVALEERIRGNCESKEEIVTLDVGGTIFRTTTSTLRKEPSMLSAMFSGNFDMTPQEDGSYFIDRNPNHFGLILDYLRKNKINLGDLTATQRKNFHDEVEYYQIPGLMESAKGHELEFSRVGDKKDLFNYLGTDGGTKSYTSPHSSGLVVINSSIQGLTNQMIASINSPNNRGNGNCNTSTEQWVSWTLQKHSFRITKYVVWGGTSCCGLGKWRLAGSNDNKATWKTLHNFDGTVAINQNTQQTLHDDTGESYKSFRIHMNGSDQSGGACHCFHIGRVEFYGFMEES